MEDIKCTMTMRIKEPYRRLIVAWSNMNRATC